MATTLTSTGAVNSFHSSYTGFGGGITLLGMQLGEIAPGGVGSGLYGMLIMAVVAVFVAGLLVGRTPEYLGKKIGTRQITYAACYLLVTPALVLGFTGLALALPGPAESMTHSGPHGFSEILYAYTSAANNNGSAFAGLNADTPWFNTTTGIAMLLGRFLPMVFVLALAGSLVEQRPVPATARHPAHRQAPLLGAAGRNDPHRHRTDLLPGPGAGSARRRARLMSTVTPPRTSRDAATTGGPRPGKPARRRAVRPGAVAAGPLRRRCASSTRA